MIQAIARTIVVVGVGAVGVTLGSPIELNRTAGLRASTTEVMNFSNTGGLACWVLPNGKLVLGAKLVSLSASILDFLAFLPTESEYEFPHYSFGTNEFGWVIRNQSSGVNHDAAIEILDRDAFAIREMICQEVPDAEGSREAATWFEAADKLLRAAEGESESDELDVLQPDLVVEHHSRPLLKYDTSAQRWVHSGPFRSRANPDYVFLMALKVPPKKVPEPDTIGLLGLALIGLVIIIRRHR